MDNLLSSTEVGTIFLDGQLRIRKFTPQIAETFSLVPHDVGRSIETFAHTDWTTPSWSTTCSACLRPGSRSSGSCATSRARPSSCASSPTGRRAPIDGVVLTLIDVSGLKAAEDALFHERYL